MFLFICPWGQSSVPPPQSRCFPSFSSFNFYTYRYLNRFHIKKKLEIFFSFRVWLISHSMIISSPIHFTNDILLFFFCKLCKISMCVLHFIYCQHFYMQPSIFCHLWKFSIFHEAFLSSSHCLSEGRVHDVLEHTTKPKGVLNSQFFYIGFPRAEVTEKYHHTWINNLYL